MRVLSLLAVALAGCYDPAIRDCQFTCPDNRCPGDLTCMAGICRTPGASTSCPCPDPPSGCSLTSNSAGLCLAVCGAATDWNAANTACARTAPWHLAVLDLPDTLSAGENAVRSPATWIGLTHGSLALAWTWISGGGTVPSTSPDWTAGTSHGGADPLSPCAALNNGKLYSDACDVRYAYACTSN
jgi:hypothetical protein